MASVNKVILLGNLGRDVELRYLPNGDAVATLNIATSETWKDKNGEKKEATEWHRVVFFGKLAEVCGEYLKKGASIFIEGKLTTRKWQDKDGQDRYTTEIRGDRMQMLGARTDKAPDGEREKQAQDYAGAKGKEPPAAKPRTDGGLADMDDDIPF